MSVPMIDIYAVTQRAFHAAADQALTEFRQAVGTPEEQARWDEYHRLNLLALGRTDDDHE